MYLRVHMGLEHNIIPLKRNVDARFQIKGPIYNSCLWLKRMIEKKIASEFKHLLTLMVCSHRHCKDGAVAEWLRRCT